MSEQIPSSIDPYDAQFGQLDPAAQARIHEEWGMIAEIPSAEAYNGIPTDKVAAMGEIAVAPAVEAQPQGFNFGPAQIAESNLVDASIDGIAFKTDLPEGVWPFEPTEPGTEPVHPARRSILPSAIDTMPVGAFQIGNPDTSDPRYARKVTITEDVDGKYINQIADMGLIKNIGGTEGMMTALGYKFDKSGYGTQVNAAPSPATIQKNAAKLGVEIQFFDDQKLIDGKSYLEAFVDGKFPVSTASAEYYLHDTRDDHLTAMVIGGTPLKNALRDAAKQALESGADTNAVAKEVDDYTAYLRGAVSPTHNNLDHPYSDYEVRTIGERIGISAQKTAEIFATARANAQQWGMELNPVPVSLQKIA